MMQKICVKSLGDGIRLTCVTTQQWKTSLMSASLVLPLGDSGRSMAALLPSLLRSSCAAYPGRQKVAVRLDELYGARLEPFVAKRGEAQVIGVMADAIDERFAAGSSGSMVRQTAQLLADILLQPTDPFDEAVVRNEAGLLQSRIAALPNNKRTWAVRRMYQLMCDRESYRFNEYGDSEVLETVTPQALRRYYKDILTTAPLEIFYCGSQPAEQVEEIFREALRGICRTRIVRPVLAAPSDVPRLRTVVEEEAVQQGKLTIGIRLGITAFDPLYPAMVLFHACYGGSTSSRLFRTVREEKSLCYYASSRTDKLKGVMAVSSGIENENEEQACAEMLRQLTLLQQGDLSKEEIEASRNSVLASFRTIADSPYALENFYQTQAVGELPETLDDIIGQLQAVTKDQITEAACRATPDLIYFLKGVCSC